MAPQKQFLDGFLLQRKAISHCPLDDWSIGASFFEVKRRPRARENVMVIDFRSPSVWFKVWVKTHELCMMNIQKSQGFYTWLWQVVREAGPCCRHWCCSRGLQPWTAAVGGPQMYIENIFKFTQRNAETKKNDISFCSGNCWTRFQEFGSAHWYSHWLCIELCYTDCAGFTRTI